MNINRFIEECNRTNLLREFRKLHGDVNENTLKEYGFIKDDYYQTDLVVFEKLTKSFTKPLEIPSEYLKQIGNKSSSRDFVHKKLISLKKNQQMIANERNLIGMPFANRGFNIVDNERKKWVFSNFGNTDFSYSPEYGEWYLRPQVLTKEITGKLDPFDQIFYATRINKELLENSAHYLIEKWNLPYRFKDAIIELILFNRIIPASNGVSIGTERKFNEYFTGYITFDKDTTATELNDAIRSFLKLTTKNFKGATKGTPRKSKDIEQTIAKYNALKELGRKDTDIFTILSRELGVSFSAVRKRVTGK